MLKNPGRKPNSATTSSTAIARACEPTAKSTIVLRLRAATLERSLLSSTATTMSPTFSGVLLRLTRYHQPCRTAMANSHCPTAMAKSAPPSACASVNAIAADGGLLQPHHHAVGGATAVDHGEPHEAGPLGREEQRAPSRRSRQRLSVDQHGQRSGAARHLERDRIGLARAVVCKFEPRVIGREHDA